MHVVRQRGSLRAGLLGAHTVSTHESVTLISITKVAAAKHQPFPSPH